MKVRKRFVASAVVNWTELNKALSKMNSEEVIYVLELENEREKPRHTFLKRLGQRYNGIRGEEVRRELECHVGN
jgi:hypothetical protein